MNFKFRGVVGKVSKKCNVALDFVAKKADDIDSAIERRKSLKESEEMFDSLVESFVLKLLEADDEQLKLLPQFVYEDVLKLKETAVKMDQQYDALLNEKGLKQCPNCGAEILKKSPYCSECGYKQDEQ